MSRLKDPSARLNQFLENSPESLKSNQIVALILLQLQSVDSAPAAPNFVWLLQLFSRIVKHHWIPADFPQTVIIVRKLVCPADSSKDIHTPCNARLTPINVKRMCAGSCQGLSNFCSKSSPKVRHELTWFILVHVSSRPFRCRFTR